MTFHFAGKTHHKAFFKALRVHLSTLAPTSEVSSGQIHQPLQSSWLHDILSSVSLKSKLMSSTPTLWSTVTVREPALRSQKLEKLTGNTKAGVSVNYIYLVNSMLGKELHVFLSPAISRDVSYPKPVKSTSIAYFYCPPRYVFFRFSN